MNVFELENFERTYFSLDDCYQFFYGVFSYRGAMAMTKDDAPNCYELINKAYEVLGDEYATCERTPSTYLEECWKFYIWPKFYNYTFCFTDEEIDTENMQVGDYQKVARVFTDKAAVVIPWLISSDEKYSLLISNLEANKAKLLAQITSTSTQSFNDTPQNQGDYADTAHNSTVTINNSSTDGGTLLSRLNEIEDNIKKLYDDWSNEFRKFIIWRI